MHVARASWLSAIGKTYESIYLRESFRVGDKVHKRNIANLTHCHPNETAAIELALKHKGNLSALNAVTELQIRQGPSVGAVWAVYQVACRLGIDRALGGDFAGQLAFHLETRPICVRTAAHTRGHVLVVMLAYLIRRALSKAWAKLDLTVEEGLHQLEVLCAKELTIEGAGNCHRIPVAAETSQALLEALDVPLAEVLPRLKTSAVTRRKLPHRRKLA